jgi:hypothetical protein
MLTETSGGFKCAICATDCILSYAFFWVIPRHLQLKCQQTPGNNPEESTRHSKHGRKFEIKTLYYYLYYCMAPW